MVRPKPQSAVRKWGSQRASDWFLIKTCWKCRCHPEQDRALRFDQRMWFTLKASICILLHRTKEGYFCKDQLWEGLIDVAMWDFMREAGSWNDYPSYAASWEQLSVVAEGWHVHLYRNANY